MTLVFLEKYNKTQMTLIIKYLESSVRWTMFGIIIADE
jgi:hypothetical protein